MRPIANGRILTLSIMQGGAEWFSLSPGGTTENSPVIHRWEDDAHLPGQSRGDD